MEIHCRKVGSQEEREQFEKLRQQVFGFELGDMRYAIDDEHQHDSLDDGESEVFLALTVAGVCIGALRMTNRARQEFIADDSYRFEVLCKKLSKTQQELFESLWLLDRVCVLAEYRGRGVMTQLLHFAVSQIAVSKETIVVNAVNAANETSLTVFESLGFVPFDAPVVAEGSSYVKLIRVFVSNE